MSGGNSAHDASHGDSTNRHGGDEEAPVLSLVDQRVVDQHISQLQGEHRRSLKRRTAIGSVLVLLAVIIVVAVTVPVTSNQRGEEPANVVPSDGSMEAEPLVGSCAMTELKRRFESSSNSTNEEQVQGRQPLRILRNVVGHLGQHHRRRIARHRGAGSRWQGAQVGPCAHI